MEKNSNSLSFRIVFLVLTMAACVSEKPQSVNVYKAGDGQNSSYFNGYSQISESNQTGSAATVAAPKTVEPLDLYLRKVAGVNVSGQGGNATITIRGITSISSRNEPLFLLDNIVINGGYAAIYEMLNTNEIANVTVLKDASETGIYGTRGSNGVILIERKTKH
jgi:TonB-dependent SusC/RagA subfamily outer membrane receptor